MGFAETFKALSDPVRREILELLKKKSLSAGEIGSHFDMTGATISYHLSILKKAGLVEETRVKNYIYYELNTSVLEEIMVWLADLQGYSSANRKTEVLRSDTQQNLSPKNEDA
ncbi:MAG: autorepressor SdpR family transcription factor [Lachnospiraceae bacterium]|nr:autorepressor SdpR family transcription factor [Lachnospiraceae bacterium]MCD7764954.1 autorepressor SdpR family transcription factor [Lachnospiraceae bacterium]